MGDSLVIYIYLLYMHLIDNYQYNHTIYYYCMSQDMLFSQYRIKDLSAMQCKMLTAK